MKNIKKIDFFLFLFRFSLLYSLFNINISFIIISNTIAFTAIATEIDNNVNKIRKHLQY